MSASTPVAGAAQPRRHTSGACSGAGFSVVFPASFFLLLFQRLAQAAAPAGETTAKWFLLLTTGVAGAVVTPAAPLGRVAPGTEVTGRWETAQFKFALLEGDCAQCATRALVKTRKRALLPLLCSRLSAGLRVIVLPFRLIGSKSSPILYFKSPPPSGNCRLTGLPFSPRLPGAVRRIPRPETGPRAAPSTPPPHPPPGARAAPAAPTSGHGGSLPAGGSAPAEARGGCRRREGSPAAGAQVPSGIGAALAPPGPRCAGGGAPAPAPPCATCAARPGPGAGGAGSGPPGLGPAARGAEVKGGGGYLSRRWALAGWL